MPHADHIGAAAGKRLTVAKGIAAIERANAPPMAWHGAMVGFQLFAGVVIEIVEITVEILIASNNSTKAGNQRHRETAKTLTLDSAPIRA